MGALPSALIVCYLQSLSKLTNTCMCCSVGRRYWSRCRRHSCRAASHRRRRCWKCRRQRARTVVDGYWWFNNWQRQFNCWLDLMTFSIGMHLSLLSLKMLSYQQSIDNTVDPFMFTHLPFNSKFSWGKTKMWNQKPEYQCCPLVDSAPATRICN